MEVNTEIVDNEIVKIKVKGELSIFYIDPFESTVQKSIIEGKSKFIFDLREVTYIDSMGIGLLSIAANSAFQKGERVTVIVNNPKIRYTLNVSRLHDFINIVETEEEALNLFRK
ncbi:MAG: STAS domain-containing protein [Brevinematales bacterium]|nr:STAS domain-containing protein [Brevinematales bacterium]